MNKTTEQLLSQLNTMQNEHIKLLNETIIEEVKRYDNTVQPLEAKYEQLIKQIEVLKHTIEIDKITIKTQEDTIKIYLDNLNSKSNV